MADSKNLPYQSEEQKNPFVIFFTNLLSSIKLPFPPKKNGANSEPAAANPPAAVDDETKPALVKLPRQSFEPIKLEVEADEAGQNTNPLILWQVYALGGVLVLRWAWMKWNERKGQKKSDNDPSPAHD